MTTARDLKLGADGDLVIEGGDLALVSGIDAIAQDVQCRLRFFKGEWFLDPDAGLSWFEQVLGKNPNAAALRPLFVDEILKAPGVRQVLSLDLAVDTRTRTLTVTFRASTDLGEISGEASIA